MPDRLLKASFYNHSFPYQQGRLLFNGVSGALLFLEGSQLIAAEQILDSGKPCVHSTNTPQPLLSMLAEARFMIDTDVDELEYLRARAARYKQYRPLSITVATTMDCNLGCYYCFEEKYPSYMSTDTGDLLLRYLTSTLKTGRHSRLQVQWFGGEPMLNHHMIEYLTPRMVEICQPLGIGYAATITTNGTAWPSSPKAIREFVSSHCIRGAQFTFDGLRDHHNRRRRYIAAGHERSSFDALCDTVDALVGHPTAHVELRLNCDPGNVGDLFRLIDFFVDRGWLYPGSNIWPYAAPISPVSETCDFLHKYKLEEHAFNELNLQFRRYLAQFVDPLEYARKLFPESISIVCDAVSSTAVMVGPDGQLYRCSGDMGNHAKSHGHIRDLVSREEASALLPILPNCGEHLNDYEHFDSFSQPTCSKCIYLPQCMSGCPKQQIETYRNGGNRDTIDGFKRYWDQMLGPTLQMYADLGFGRHDGGPQVGVAA